MAPIQFLKWLTQLFTKSTTHEYAVRELEYANRDLLEAQAERDYMDSVCKYHEARIRRLTSYLELL